MRDQHNCLLVKVIHNYYQGPWEGKKRVALLAGYCFQELFYWEYRVISNSPAHLAFFLLIS